MKHTTNSITGDRLVSKVSANSNYTSHYGNIDWGNQYKNALQAIIDDYNHTKPFGIDRTSSYAETAKNALESQSRIDVIGQNGNDGQHYSQPIDKNVEAVIQSFKDRAMVGFEKYGTTTERTDIDLVGWLQHLQEELMDSVVYIERIKQELKK